MAVGNWVPTFGEDLATSIFTVVKKSKLYKSSGCVIRGRAGYVVLWVGYRKESANTNLRKEDSLGLLVIFRAIFIAFKFWGRHLIFHMF